jgi:O-glycosyl hydrolase
VTSKTLKIFSAWIPLLVLSAALSAGAADRTDRIDPHVVLVKAFEGWGTSLCWWAHVLGDSTNRETYADLAFKDLGLNIVRYNIGGGEDPARPDRMEARARMPGFEPKPGVWDWEADANQRWFLRAAVKRGADRVVAFANSPPYWMTVSGSVTGAADGSRNNLRTDAEEAFAEYLVTVVRHLTDLDGVQFDLLTPMNEPAAAWWKLDGHQEGTHMSPDQEERMIHLLYPLLQRESLRTGLEATEDNDERHTADTVRGYSAETRRRLAVIASHSYSAKAPDALRAWAEADGKPLWISEYGDGEPSGLKMARRIRDDIVRTHARAWIYWQFAEPDSDWGLVRFHPAERNPAPAFNRKFYVLSQFSRFIRPGDQIVDSGDPDSLAAYNAGLRRLVIVSVNDRAVPGGVMFDLSAFGGGTAAVGHRTSAHEDLAVLPSQPIRQHHLTVTLPAQSVTTWVIDGMAPL